jgi:GcrA cell cycle regulator
MNNKSTWTEEQIERLRRLWLQGFSAARIAMRLNNGHSRNSVIGIIHRRGFNGRPPKPRVIKRDRTIKPRVKRERTITLAPLVPVRSAPPPPPPPPAPENGLRLTELTEGCCHWPYGDRDFRFCGAPAVNGVYCAAHLAVAHPQK